MNRYTEEQHRFFKEYVLGHTYVEIAEEFNRRFPDTHMNPDKVKIYMGNHKLKNGLTGRFKKGCISFNKGKKGQCSPGCEKTWFQTGHMPKNHKPIGSISIWHNYKRGEAYVYEKVEEPNVWKMQHVINWEKVNGPIPKGMAVIFLNQNTLDTRVENLRMVSRAELLSINQKRKLTDNAEMNEAKILITKIETKVNVRK